MCGEQLRLGVALGAVGAASALAPLVSTLAPLIRADLALSRFQFGTIATLYFGVGAVASLMAGRVIDGLGTRRILSATLLLAALGIAGVGLSGSYPMLLAFATLAGFALSASNPVTNTVIVSVAPPGERGTMMGVKHAGVPTTGALIGLALPPAAVVLGWRGVVLVVAAAVFLLGCAMARIGREADRPASAADDGGVRSPLLWIGGYAFLMGAGGGATQLYLPLYGHEAIGLSVPAGGAAAAVAQAAAVASRVIWTRASERSRVVGRPLALVSLCALAAVAPVLAADAVGPVLFWLAALAIGAGMLGWTPVAMLAALRLVGPGEAGRASGVVVAGFYAGFMVGPAIFGRVVDATGGYMTSWLLAAGAFAAASALAEVRGGRGEGSP